jgi:phytol kinase
LNDWVWLGVSFAYVLAMVGLAEGLRRRSRISFDLSRKMIHVSIGTWILPTVLLFHSRWFALTPAALFVLLNLLSMRGRWSKAMDAEAGANLGTVLFPLSFVILLACLWDRGGGRAAAAAGILAMAWGDAAAALIGIRWGRHRYRVGSGFRSLEGSAAMFAFTLAAVAAAGLLVARSPYPVAWIALSAALATVLEAGSRRGLDNLLVPLGTAFFVWGMGLLA